MSETRLRRKNKKINCGNSLTLCGALLRAPWQTAFQIRREETFMAQNSNVSTTPHEAITPVGINHLVLNVRDMEESHKFWTEIMGFKQVGELHARPDVSRPKMRFYSGDHGGKLNHH